MTKVLSLPRNIWHWFASHAISPVRHTLFSDMTASLMAQIKQLGQRLVRIIERNGLWVCLVALAGPLSLILWNSSLFIALSIGLGTTLLIHQVSVSRSDNRPTSWTTLVKRLSGPYATIAIAVGCGLLSLVASYLTLLIWHDTQSLALAVAILLQGLGLFCMLGLFGWQLVRPASSSLPQHPMDDWVNQLTATEPLKRLIAVQQLCRHLESADQTQAQDLQAILQLLDQQEQVPAIQNAITKGLDSYVSLKG